MHYSPAIFFPPALLPYCSLSTLGLGGYKYVLDGNLLDGDQNV